MKPDGFGATTDLRVMTSKGLCDLVVIQRQSFHWHISRAGQRVMTYGHVFELYREKRFHFTICSRSEFDLYLMIQRPYRGEKKFGARNAVFLGDNHFMEIRLAALSRCRAARCSADRAVDSPV